MKFILNKDKVTLDGYFKANVSGTVNYYEIPIEYDETWNNLTIKAIMIKNGLAEEISVINNKFFIDKEKSGVYDVGFVGYTIENEQKVYQVSTDLISFIIDKGAGEIEGVESHDIPTPSEWEIYIAQIQEMIDGLEEQIPTKLSQLQNDNHTVQDENYVHTDNNFSNEDKDKLDSLENYDDTEIKADIQEINGDIDEINTNLLNYSLITETGSKIDLEINSSTYELVAKLYNKNNNLISTSRKIDLPIESMIVDGSYDSVNKKIVLILDNGNTIDIPVGDLISGLQTEITSENKLESDLVDDTNQNNKFVTTQEKETWNNKLDESDLADYVKNTDYATTSVGGVIKASDVYGTGMSPTITNKGVLYALGKTYGQYVYGNTSMFISKGTLENVITGKQLINQQTLEESQAIQDKKIIALENQIPTGEVNDTSITLTDSADYKVKEFGIEGNTEQATRSGKNIFNKEGILNTPLSDWITTPQNYFVYLELPNTFKNIITSSIFLTGTSQNLVLGFTDTIAVSIQSNNRILNNGTLITPKTLDFTNSEHVYLAVGNSQNISQDLVEVSYILNNYNIQTELGSTATTPYEEYGAMPSPDFPSPVNNVTGDVEVKVQNDSLFDLKDLASIDTNYTPYSNGYTFSSKDAMYYTGVSLDIPIKLPVSYSYKIKNGTGTNLRLKFWFDNGNTASMSSYGSGTGTSEIEITANNITSSGATSITKIGIDYSSAGTFSIRDFIINEGTTAGEYIPHQEQNYPISLGDIELCKIGDSEDYIYKENGNWYKYGSIGKEIYNGSETGWGVYRSDTTKPCLGFSRNISNSNNEAGLSNYFIHNGGVVYASSDEAFWLTSNRCYFSINKDRLADYSSTTAMVNSFETWLSTHNTIVYYVLSTPVITQITDTTLINQLNALEEAYTYEGVTHIDTNAETKPYLDVIYRKDIELLLENLEARLSLLE